MKSSNHESIHSGKGKSKVVVSSGAIEATPSTQIISVNMINIDPDQPRDVIVEMKNWTTCPPTELGKLILLCGEQIDPVDIGYEEEGSMEEFDPTVHPFEMEDFIPAITKPLFFRIPPQMQLTVLADFPQPQLLPSNPCYEIRVYLTDPTNLLISSYGLNDEFDPQEGNTVLHHHFFATKLLNLPFPENPIRKDKDDEQHN